MRISDTVYAHLVGTMKELTVTESGGDIIILRSREYDRETWHRLTLDAAEALATDLAARVKRKRRKR